MTEFSAIPTRSGLLVDVRLASEADETALEAFFDQVNDDDRRFRFFSANNHIGHDQLIPLVKTDHFHSESFLGFDHATGELIASGLLACDDAMQTAEVAVSVRADYRGKGVGWAMLDLLATEAQKRGVSKVMAIENRENHAAIELEREKGFKPEAVQDDPGIVILTKTF